MKSEGLRFDSSRGLRIFSLFRTCDKSKIHFSPQYTPCIKIYIQTKRNKFWRGGEVWHKVKLIVVNHDRLETLPQAAPAQENFDSVKKLSLHLSHSNSSKVVLWGYFQGAIRSLFLSWERGRVQAFLINYPTPLALAKNLTLLHLREANIIYYKLSIWGTQ